VVASGTSPFHYQWYFNGSAVGGDNATLTVSSVKSQNTGSYVVAVRNNWGSTTSAVVTLTMVVAPTIAGQPQSQAVAQGQYACFSVAASGSPLGYQWSFNGTTLPTGTSSALGFTNARMANAGSYSVVLSNAAGCVTSAVATLTVTNPVVRLATPCGGALSPRGFTLQASVPIGCTYVILATTNQRDWVPVYTNASLTGSDAFTDPDAGHYTMRFYRIVVY